MVAGVIWRESRDRWLSVVGLETPTLFQCVYLQTFLSQGVNELSSKAHLWPVLDTAIKTRNETDIHMHHQP